MNSFKILAVGDVIGEAGCLTLRQRLGELKNEFSADLTIVNGENAAETGKGISPAQAEQLFQSGADMITTGNHIFRRRDIYEYLDDHSAILRPANFPGSCPGHGYSIEEFRGIRVLVMNLLGTVYLESLTSPFETADAILKNEAGNFDLSVCDFHAEATSEKGAFAHYFDGRINFIFGTHTHIQTNDLHSLPKGTAFITDLGMVGPEDSVIGVKCEQSISRFLTRLPTRYEVASGDCIFGAAMVEIDLKTNKILKTNLIKLGGSRENS